MCPTHPEAILISGWGGHFVTVLAAQDESTGELTIANPAPSALRGVADLPANAVQRLPTSKFTGAIGGSSPSSNGSNYLQFPDLIWFDGSQTITPLLEAVCALTVDASQLSVNNNPPTQWNLTTSQALHTNGTSLTISAPLAGTGGLSKQGGGSLSLSSTNECTGQSQMTSGLVSSDQASGAPFGTGSMSLSSGTLQLAPLASNSDVALSLASADGAQVTFGVASALQLQVGKNTGLAVTLGGASAAGNPGLVRAENGTLVISVDSGAAALGTTCTLEIPAGIAGLLDPSSPIVEPAVVAMSPGAANAGDFLDFKQGGFVLPAYTSSSSVVINSALASDVYSVDDDQTLDAGATATVFALKVGPFSVDQAGPGAILQVGSQELNRLTGVILNGGTLSGFQLDFGASDAAIYCGQTSIVSATIAGSGSLLLFGPGALCLGATNTYSGGTTVQSGQLQLSGAGGSGTGMGPVTVTASGVLVIGPDRSVAGNISVEQGGTLLLDGGTAAGTLSVDDSSTLAGLGIVSGSASVLGQILASTVPGAIEFQADATFGLTSFFYWTPFQLVDNDTTGEERQWNSIVFSSENQSDINVGTEGNFISIFLDMTKIGPQDPNSSDDFWTSPHRWTLFESENVRFNSFWYLLSQPAFVAGYFTVSWDDALKTIFLNFVVAPVSNAATRGRATARRGIRSGKSVPVAD